MKTIAFRRWHYFCFFFFFPFFPFTFCESNPFTFGFLACQEPYFSLFRQVENMSLFFHGVNFFRMQDISLVTTSVCIHILTPNDSTIVTKFVHILNHITWCGICVFCHNCHLCTGKWPVTLFLFQVETACFQTKGWIKNFSLNVDPITFVESPKKCTCDCQSFLQIFQFAERVFLVFFRWVFVGHLLALRTTLNIFS